MEQVFRSVVLLSLIGAVLSAVLLLLKPVTKRAFGSRWQCYIWLCVLVVMTLPVTLEMPFRAEIPAADGQAARGIQDTAADGRTEKPPAPANGSQAGYRGLGWVRDMTQSLPDALVYAWLLGAGVFLCSGLVRYRLFLRAVSRSSGEVSCPALEAMKKKLGIRAKIQVKVTELSSAPLMLGLFTPTLLLPNVPLDESELRFILLHELTHFKRRDLWYKWFAMLVNAVHWFNPMIYLVAGQISEECEISCDIAVTRDMSGEEKKGYMNTIMALMLANIEKSKMPATAMASDKKLIKRRFSMIKDTKKKSRFTSVLSVFTAMLILSAALLASGAAAAGKSSDAIRVFNGNQAIELTNRPFTENGELYLPLRETLNAFGIDGIAWDEGIMQITLPVSETSNEARLYPADACQIALGSTELYFPVKAAAYHLRSAPMLVNGTAYAPLDFFEGLITHGQIPQFRISVIRSSDPGDYYSPGEEVFIGTAAEQDGYNPVDENGNRRPVKRIIIDESGAAIAVVTAENQNPEAIGKLREAKIPGSVHAAGYQGLFGTSLFGINALGEYIGYSAGIFIQKDNESIAYIPPADQINRPVTFDLFGGD